MIDGLKEPNSPRIVTIKQHKQSIRGCGPLYCQFVHYHNQPSLHTLSSLVHLESSKVPKRRGTISMKRQREQYLGSLKDPLNKTRKIYRSSMDEQRGNLRGEASKPGVASKPVTLPWPRSSTEVSCMCDRINHRTKNISFSSKEITFYFFGKRCLDETR